jgi:hypothetical protein
VIRHSALQLVDSIAIDAKQYIALFEVMQSILMQSQLPDSVTYENIGTQAGPLLYRIMESNS